MKALLKCIMSLKALEFVAIMGFALYALGTILERADYIILGVVLTVVCIGSLAKQNTGS